MRAVSCGLAPSHHHGSGEVTCPVSATWVPPAPRGVLFFGLPSTKTSRFWTGGEFNEVGGAAGLLSHPFGAEARPSAGAAACSQGWSRVGGTQGGRNVPPRWSGKSPPRESRAENPEESRELEADQRLGWGRVSSSERHHQAQLGGTGRGSLPVRTGWRGGSSLRAVAGRVFFLQHHDLTPKMLCNGPRRGARCWSTATTSHSTPVLLRSWPKSPKNPTKLGGDGAGAEPVGSGSFAPAPALDAVAKSQQSRNAKQLRGLESCPLRAPPD